MLHQGDRIGAERIVLLLSSNLMVIVHGDVHFLVRLQYGNGEAIATILVSEAESVPRAGHWAFSNFRYDDVAA